MFIYKNKLAFAVFLLGLIPSSVFLSLYLSIGFYAKQDEKRILEIENEEVFLEEKLKYLKNVKNSKLIFWYRIQDLPSKEFLES